MLEENQSHRTAERSDPASLRVADSGHGSSALKIVVMGAGESAWMTAACLSAAFPRELASITVISDGTPHCDFPGESHQPSFFQLLSNLGITEEELLRRCNGVYELGTEFRAGADKYFVAATEVTEIPLVRRIAEMRPETLKGRQHQFLPQAAAASLHRAPARFLGPSELQRFGAYRLSFDGSLFAAMMREYSLGQGVTEIRSRLVSIVRTEDGFIRRLQADAAAGLIDCDLVLCCSERIRRQICDHGMLTFGNPGFTPFTRISSCFVEIDSDPPSFSQVVLRQSELSVIRWQRSGFSCDTFWPASRLSRASISPEQLSAGILREFARRNTIKVSEPVTREFSVGCCGRMWDKNLVFVGAGALVTDPVVHAGRHLCQAACELLLDYLTTGTESYSVVAKEYDRRLVDAYGSWSSMAQYMCCLLGCGHESESQSDRVNGRVTRQPDPAAMRVPSGASQADFFHLQAAFCAFSNESRLSVPGSGPAEERLLEEELREMTEKMVGSLPGHSEYLDWIHGLSQRRSA